MGSDCLSEPRTAVPKVLKKVSYRWCTKGKGKVNRCQLMHSSSLLFFKKLRHELTVQRFNSITSTAFSEKISFMSSQIILGNLQWRSSWIFIFFLSVNFI